MMRLFASLLMMMTLVSCISYRNADDGIGQLRQLHDIRELQGIYSVKPLNHGDAGPTTDTLSTRFQLGLEAKRGLYTVLLDPAVSVRILVIDTQTVAVQAFDVSGKLVKERKLLLPQSYVFGATGLCEARTKWGDNDNVQSGNISVCWTLNEKGNLVHVQAIRATGNIIPSIKHTTDYREYPRLQ